MKYSLLAAAVVALTLTACGHKPGEGKPGQYPPSLYSGKDHGVMGEAPPAAQHPTEAAPAPAPAESAPAPAEAGATDAHKDEAK